MAIEIKVPQLGESVSEATVATWFKKKGDAVTRDEPLVELETDKVTMEVYAPASGVLSDVMFDEGSDVEVGTVLGKVEEGDAPAAKAEPAAQEEPAAAPEEVAPAPAAEAKSDLPLSPAVRKMVDENGLDASSISGTGKDGRLTKADVQAHLDGGGQKDTPKPAASSPEAPAPRERVAVAPSAADPEGREERVKMTRLRKRVAERLKAAQDTAAMLTTFNEVDMTELMDMRSTYKDMRAPRQLKKCRALTIQISKFF